MKKKKHLQTSFVKFLFEKLKESQELPDEETNEPNEKIIDDIDDILNYDEVQDEQEPEEDENVDDLIIEYKKLEKKYWKKSNDKIFKR